MILKLQLTAALIPSDKDTVVIVVPVISELGLMTKLFPDKDAKVGPATKTSVTVPPSESE